MIKSPSYAQQIMRNSQRIWLNYMQLRFYSVSGGVRSHFLKEMRNAAKENWHIANVLNRLP